MMKTKEEIKRDILEYVEHRRVTDYCIHNALREPMTEVSSDEYTAILNNMILTLEFESYINVERKYSNDKLHVPFYTITDTGREYLKSCIAK